MNFKTKSELINEWLDRYPLDIDHPDLIQMALAGHVETEFGFVSWLEYDLFQSSKDEELANLT